MLSKREFITGAACVAATASSVSWGGAVADVAGTGRAVNRPQLVVFNERYADACAFAGVLAARGIATVPVAGDMGTLWYGGLRDRVVGGETRIAGMGTPTDLLILRELGREVGLRVRHEGLHDCRGCGTLTHTVRGSADAAAFASGLEGGAGQWAAALAQAILARTGVPVTPVAFTPAASAPVTAGPAASAAGGAANLIIPTRVAGGPDHPGMLVSWILA